MRSGKQRKPSARLARLETRFASWRKTRQRGERIPEPLWLAAAKLAADDGESATASALGLNYYALQERLARPDGQSVSNVSFLALPPAPTWPASECIIELEDGAGTSLASAEFSAKAAQIATLPVGRYD